MLVDGRNVENCIPGSIDLSLIKGAVLELGMWSPDSEIVPNEKGLRKRSRLFELRAGGASDGNII